MAESWTTAELLRASWTEADLEWEAATEAALVALGGNDIEEAKASSAKVLRIARQAFTAEDPRLGSSLANHSVCLRAVGDLDVGEKLLVEARQIWQACGPWIKRMTAPRVARSSLFHMRMEQRHRDSYEARWRVKWQDLAAEAREKLEPSKSDRSSTPAQEVVARWRRERPAMLNDTRKLLAAAILIAPQA